MDDDEEEGGQLVTVVARPSERTAEDAARRLVESGLGAVVEPLTPESTDTDDDTGLAGSTRSTGSTGFAVRVMPHQVERACTVLGVAIPEHMVAVLEAEEKPPAAPWKRILLIWGIAMITIPLLAGYLAYLLFSR